MTLPETVKLLAVICEVYPRFMDGKQIQTTTTLWQKLFASDTYEEVEAAFYAFVSTDEKGFPPAPGAIRSLLNKLKQPEGETTETQAWALVQKALRNSLYNSEKEFAALPPEVQDSVGSPSMLREWAAMDSETVNSVVASNFMRSYKVRSGHVREIQALPDSVREVFGLLGEAFRLPQKCLEPIDETKSLPEPETEKPEPKYREPSEGWKIAKARMAELRKQQLNEQKEKNERAKKLFVMEDE